MRWVRIAVFFLVFFPLYSQGQGLTVEEIRFKNIKRTSVSHLERYIQTEIGDKLDSATLLKDVQRLVNLNPVATASFEVRKDGDRVMVVFNIEEIGTFMPIVTFGGSSENFWILAGAKEINLFGKGRELAGYYQFYDRHTFMLDYRVPYIGHSKWGWAGSLKKWSTNEPLYWDQTTVMYYYDHYSIGGSAIYEIIQKNYIETGMDFFVEDYTKFPRQDNLPGPSDALKRKALGKFRINLDKVDYHYFYQDGWANSFNVESVFNFDAAGKPGQSPWFFLFWHELKYFKRLAPKVIAASRLKFGLSTNDNSPFAPFVLDNHVNIRGAGAKADRGTGTIFLNMEYRHTIFENYLGAIQGVIFSDMGSWRKPGGTFDDFVQKDIYKLYAGTGLRFIYKKIYGATLRLDYSLNLNDTGYHGFVVGAGQYF